MDVALAVIERIASSIEPKFEMTEECRKFYSSMIRWFHADEDFLGYLNRGILLMGGTGSGKTLAMKVMLRYRDIDNIFCSFQGKYQKLEYQIADVTDIRRSYLDKGYDGIRSFIIRNVICIDDLGYELDVDKRFGNSEQVIPYILGERYAKEQLTFATTNLPDALLREKYDDRTYSRLWGMFNVITVKGPDYRIKNSNL